MDVELKPISSNVEAPRPVPAPLKPSALALLARRVTAEVRSIRQGFTRQNVISFAKTMAWVVPLTLLIWIYAETAQVEPQSNVQIPIQLVSNDANKAIKLVKPPAPDEFIVCDLEGPSANLHHFMDQLSPTDPLKIDIDTSKLPPGENYVSTTPKLMDNDRVKADGITVLKCEPEVLTFYVDQIDHRQATVVAPPGINTLKSASFVPPTITVTGPEHDLDAMQINGQMTVQADIANLPELSAPGPHPVSGVRLATLDDMKYSPDKVNATLVVTSPDATGVLHSVPVWLDASPAVLDKYTVTFEGFYSGEVKVVGPPEQIAQVEQSNPAHLDLQITIDDVSNPHAVPLVLRGLPEGVRLAPGQTLVESFTATPK